MKILIVGKNLANYIAKQHESFRTGLAALYDVRFFGEGYAGYDPSLKTYQQIIDYMYPDGAPDLLIMHHNFPRQQPYLTHEGLSDVTVKKAFIQSDFWDMLERPDGFVRFVLDNKVDYILSCFPQPLVHWRETPIGPRMVFLPPSFDPRIFTDWRQKKDYDVGFLAAGTVKPELWFYPERHDFHNRLMKMTDIRYLYADHPGWGDFAGDAPLVGVGFSRAINSCKIFVTTGGVLKNPQPKVFEALASRSMLMSTEVVAEDSLGLVDGVNYVKIQPDKLEEQVRYYLANPPVMEAITENGYQLALCKHTGYARAADFRTALYGVGFREQG